MSSRKTYDTDIITLRRIFAVSPGTNAPIPSGNIMATTSHGEAAYVNPYSIPAISQLSTALLSLPSTISTSIAEIGGVSQLLAGSGISLNPTNGIGIVTITATGGGGSVTTANLTSTVIGLGTAGYISSAIGVATIPGGLVSTANLSRLISTANLAGLVSTGNLAGHISTANLNNLVSTLYLATQLGSTVIGLGTAGYFSTIPRSLQTLSISTGNVFTSSVILIDTTIGYGYTGFANQLIVSSGNLLLNNNSLSGGGGGGGAVTQIVGGTNITISPPGGTGVVTINGASIPSLVGLVSTANLASFVSTSYLATQLASTVIGLGTAGYISSAVATLPGGLVSTANLASLVSTANLASLVSTANLASLVSTANLASLVSTANLASLVSTANLASLVSTANLASLVSTANLAGLVSSSYFASQLASTVIGLGTAGYISSSVAALPGGLVSTANLAGFVSTSYLATQVGSTVIGLGTIGYLSTIPNLLQTRIISTGTVFTSSVMLIDTTIGGAYAGFANQLIVSAGTLLLNNNSLSGGGGGGGAVTQILGGTNITISPPGGTGVVTINGASFPSLGGIVSTANLASHISTANLANLVSTANLANLVSTANLANLVSTSYLASQLTSTVIGLGTAGYVSTSQLTSTTSGTFNYISSFVSSFNSIATAYSGETLYLNYSVANSPYQALELQAVAASQQSVSVSIPKNTADSNIGNFMTDFSVPSFIPTGFWDLNLFALADSLLTTAYYNLYLRDGAGTETLLGTSGSVTIASAGLPTQITLSILINYTTIPANNKIVVKVFAHNNDTNGASRTVTAYYQNAYYSHLHTTFGTIIPQDTLTSTVAGLGTAGYLSTIVWNSVVSSANLARLVSTANLVNLVSTANLANLISTANLANLVSTANLANLISTANLANLVSTANLANLISTANLANLVSTANLANLISTANLANLVSTANLADLTSTANFASLISTANLANIVSTSYLLNGIEFSSLSNETARMNFSSLFVNNVPILFDQYGNLSLSFQTL